MTHNLPTDFWSIRVPWPLIGAGCEIWPSSLGPAAGLGVFMGVDVKKDHPCTIYDGWIVAKSTIGSAVDATGSIRSHTASFSGGQYPEYKIVGLDSPQIGRGAGSFINSCVAYRNCVRITCDQTEGLPSVRHTYAGLNSYIAVGNSKTPRVAPLLGILVALRDISAVQASSESM